MTPSKCKSAMPLCCGNPADDPQVLAGPLVPYHQSLASWNIPHLSALHSPTPAVLAALLILKQ